MKEEKRCTYHLIQWKYTSFLFSVNHVTNFSNDPTFLHCQNKSDNRNEKKKRKKYERDLRVQAFHLIQLKNIWVTLTRVVTRFDTRIRMFPRVFAAIVHEQSYILIFVTKFNGMWTMIFCYTWFVSPRKAGCTCTRRAESIVRKFTRATRQRGLWQQIERKKERGRERERERERIKRTWKKDYVPICFMFPLVTLNVPRARPGKVGKC